MKAPLDIDGVWKQKDGHFLVRIESAIADDTWDTYVERNPRPFGMSFSAKMVVIEGECDWGGSPGSPLISVLPRRSIAILLTSYNFDTGLMAGLIEDLV